MQLNLGWSVCREFGWSTSANYPVKIGTAFDGSDLYNEQFDKALLPGNATLDSNTLFLPLGALNYANAKYVWVKVMLLGGGFNEIKITTEE